MTSIAATSSTSALGLSTAASTGTSDASTATGNNVSPSQDRFLKLLVAQLNNQDPLNPMDNAQMTSQLAQINTASGVSDLNQTLKGVSQQLGSQMMLYGASLVGREVLTSGNTLNLSQGQASAAFELPADAQAVQVRVTSAGGQLMDTLNLGALASGRQSFTWNASNASDGPYSFEVRARNGAQTLTATPLSHSTVKSVSLDSAGLRIDTGSASRLTLSDIQAIL